MITAGAVFAATAIAFAISAGSSAPIQQTAEPAPAPAPPDEPVPAAESAPPASPARPAPPDDAGGGEAEASREPAGRDVPAAAEELF